MATAAPEGSGWARELKLFAREVEAGTKGEVGIKWYFGGLVGDEYAVGDRLRRGQLDGATSGHMLCQRVAPSLRTLRVPGVVRTRDESDYVLAQLTPALTAEAEHEDVVLLQVGTLGPDVIFSRRPIANLSDLRRLKLWRWSLDDVGVELGKQMGLQIVATPLEEATQAFDEQRVDGFWGIPTAAIAFQWSTRARHLIDLRAGYLSGCLVLSTRAFDRLPSEQKNALRVAAARLGMRINQLGRSQDDALFGGIFSRQGMQVSSPSAAFRSEFFELARQVRERSATRLMPDVALDRVLRLLADFRADRGSADTTEH
jgi:TRAP-type C4-dicarboxylate transport system substrate-binding protein